MQKRFSLTGLAGIVILATAFFGVNASADVATYVVPAITDIKILPDSVIPSDYLSTTISVFACRGEYEPASFVVRGTSAVNGLTVTASALQRQGGAGSISNANVDIRVVKCWYQAGYDDGKSQKHLTPELLLKDNSFVKVENTNNYIKLSTGAYVWISEVKTNTGWEINWNTNFPIQDSATLQSVNIGPNSNQQFWVTVKIPEAAVAGVYTGAIHLADSGSLNKDIALSVFVPDMYLSLPYINYSIYYSSVLNTNGSISHVHKNETQLRAELKDLLAHGIINPTVYPQYSNTNVASILGMRNEIGLTNDPFYYMGLTIASYGTNLPALTNAYAQLAAYFAPYGAQHLYITAPDEQNMNNSANRAQISAIHNVGGKVFCAQVWPGDAESIADLLDVVIKNGAPNASITDLYHSYGHKVFSYAYPFSAAELPEIIRRNYGLLMWHNDYDGVMNWAYQGTACNIWNDFDHQIYRDFVYAYPTTNGVVDTIQWEGVREAADDMRYLTTLLETIDYANAYGDATQKQLAKDAEAWLHQLDANLCDMDDSRLQMADYILRLQGLSGMYDHTLGDLRGWWRFEELEGALAYDTSDSGNSGSMSATAGRTNGLVGNGLSFITSSYVDCGKNTSLNVSNEYTISLWVKPTTTNASSRILITRGMAVSGEYLIQLYSGNLIYFYQTVTGNLYAVQQAYAFPHDNAFHHVAMTFKYNGTNSTLSAYLDGQFKGSRSAAGAPNYNNSGSLVLGSGNFNGIMDEVKLYNKTLDQAAISNCYNDGRVRGCWEFDERPGVLAWALDSSGNNNHGLLGYYTNYYGYMDYRVNGAEDKALPLQTGWKVDCGSNSSLNVSNAYTIEAWVKSSTNNVASRWLVGRGGASSGGYLIQLYSGNLIYFYQSVTGNFYAVSQNYLFPTNGDFHHVAMTFKYNGTNSTLSSYLDGQLKSSSSAAGAPNYANNYHLVLGSGNFNGVLDSVRLYNRVLTTNEIAAHAVK